MNLKLSNDIKAEAKQLGFFACGIARADAVDSKTISHYKKWLSEGKNSEMVWLDNHSDMRFDPRLLMPGLKSIVCVAMNYCPAKPMPEEQYQLAAYAYGQDYHTVIKDRLHRLAKSFLFEHYRAFCDSAPVLERYWAVKAGIGWVGRNHQLILPHGGSMFFLGELFLDVELEYDEPMKSRCGNCTKCVDACPTGALSFSDGNDSNIEFRLSDFDSNKCLSYQTIENRGEIPLNLANKMGNTIYGCDCCQKCCPWNRFSVPNTIDEFQPSDKLLSMTRQDWKQLSEEQYRSLFKGSAVKRAKYEGLMRNIRAVENNESQRHE
jgi:epoxyqueuosine reductase